MTGDNSISVLVVDDEKERADTYSLQVQERYDVRTAYGGTEALEKVGQDVDIVVLDRLMPDVCGDEVLREIRDRDLDCRVIMLTASDPEFDIVGMPFDDYICTPIDRTELRSAIEHQVRIIASERLRDYFHLTAKRSILEAELNGQSPEQNETYSELDSRTEALRHELTGVLDAVDDVAESFSRIEPDGVRTEGGPLTAPTD